MAPPKTVLDKIVHAVTKMADPTGSSRVAIVKFLKREFDLDNANAIKKALKQGVDKLSLIHISSPRDQRGSRMPSSA